jgi:hypothetical protein
LYERVGTVWVAVDHVGIVLLDLVVYLGADNVGYCTFLLFSQVSFAFGDESIRCSLKLQFRLVG